MRSAWTAGLVALVAMIAVGCGSSPVPLAHLSTPSPIASPASSPSAPPLLRVPGACDATHRCLALVTLRGSDKVVVRDVTDIDHAVTVNEAGLAAFISATELSYEDGTTLYRMPLSGSPQTVVATAAKGIGLFAWTADGKTAGYMTFDGLHVITAGRDQVFGQPLPVPAGGYGCESQACADGWDSRLAFSPDGAYVSLMVLSGPVSGFHLWSTDGKLITSPTSPGGTMSVWSGRTLYYLSANGVKSWRDGVTSSFLAGVRWVRPKGSPAGGLLVYEARDASGLAHVYTVDTANGKVRELKAGRKEPAFLTSRYVWYAGERMCLASDPCVTGPTIATGKTYIYDLQTGTEYDSIITNVYDVWPHAA